MKKGKLSESALKRSIFKRIRNKRPEVIVSAAQGVDVSAFKAEGSEVIVTSTQAFPDFNSEGLELSIVSALNNLATAGADAIGVSIGALLPTDSEEQVIKDMADTVEDICRKYNIQALGGHTQITEAVNKPVVTITSFGIVHEDKITTSKGAKPDQDIVVTKWIGLAGTEILAKERAGIIAEKYKQELINVAISMGGYISVLPEAAIAKEAGAAAMHDLSQGGIYNGLWEFAESSRLGLTVDLRKIPLKQETVEICEIFDINPYRLLSTGSLLIACDDGEGMVNSLRDAGIEAVVIGRFTDSNDRIIIKDDETTYLDSPKPEELLIK